MIINCNENGTTKLASYEYDAFGNQKSGTGTWNNSNPIRYCGEYYDRESGLIYLRARYYDSEEGRFLSEDPHWNVDNMIYGDREYSLGKTRIPYINAIMQNSNLYVYGMNKPLKYGDSTGEQGTEIAFLLLGHAFFGGGKPMDYSYNKEFQITIQSSPIMKEEINKQFRAFKNSGKTNDTITGSIGFYGDDRNANDVDLHLAVGKANYTMTFKKETKQKKFLWQTWTETSYSVTVTVSDTYDFDEYREGASISNRLNNWGYDMQKSRKLTPFYWSITFSKGL